MKILKANDNSSLLLKLLEVINKKGEVVRKNGKDVTKFSSQVFIECSNVEDKFVIVDGLKINPFFPFFKFLWFVSRTNSVDFLAYFGELSSFEYYCNDKLFRGADKKILNDGGFSVSTPDGGLSFVVDGKHLNLEIYNYQESGCFLNYEQSNFVFYSYLLEYFADLTKLVPNKISYLYKNCYFKNDGLNFKDIRKKNKSFFVFKGLFSNFYKKRFKKVKNKELLLSKYHDFASNLFDLDVEDFFSKPISNYAENFDDYRNYNYFSQFFNEVVKPVFLAFLCYKYFEDPKRALSFVSECKQLDLKESVIKYINNE